jgi:hypothetical protein
MSDWTDSDWADGHKVSEWIRKHFDQIDLVSPGLARALRRWEKNGETPSTMTLDHYLSLFNCHISQLPDSVWLKAHPTGRKARVANEKK